MTDRRNAEDCRWCRPLIDKPGGIFYPWICRCECVGCGSDEIVYENYKGQRFCCPCAKCCTTTEQGNNGRTGILATLTGWLRRRR